MSNKTEIIIFREELLANPFFLNSSDYGWETTGTWSASTGQIAKTPGDTGTLFQTVLKPTVTYKFYFRINFIGAGSVVVKTGATTHATYTTSGFKELVFEATDEDITLSVGNTCDAVIMNAHLAEYPEQYSLDLFEDTPIPFNFNVDDIFNPKARKTTFTKTIVLPGSNNNNVAFQSIYKVNADSAFSPFKKTRCLVKNSGITVLDGYMSLDNIEKIVKDKIESVSYSITIYGESLNLIQKLGEKKISDLDFSAYDHDLELQNIRFTWPANFTGGGIATRMTYARVNGTYAATQTVLYTFPALNTINSYALNGFNWVELEFLSNHTGISAGDHIYIDDTPGGNMAGDFTVVEVSGADKIVIDAKFSQTSYSGIPGNVVVTKRRWDSFGYFYPLADSGQFTKIVAPGENFIQERLYTIEYLHPTDDLTNICTDPVTGLAMTPATGVTFMASDGASAAEFPLPYTTTSVINAGPLIVGKLYTFTAYTANDDFSNVGGPPPVAVGNFYNGQSFYATGAAPAVWVGTNLSFQLDSYVFNGSIITTYVPRSLGGTLIRTKSKTANHWYVEDMIPHIFVREVWSKMFAEVDYYYDAPFIDSNLFRRLVMPMDMKFNVNDGSYPGMASGYTVNMNDWLPSMSLKEFFLSILNMFNLVMIEDKDIKNLVHIVERNDFFNGTQKQLVLDGNSPLKIQTAASLVPEKYVFKYKDGPDYYNKLYVEQFGKTEVVERTFGDRHIFTGNELSQDEKKTELAFNATVPVGHLVGDDGNYNTFNPTYNQNKVFGAYFQLSGSSISRPQANRILIAGIRGTEYPWSFTTAPASTNSNTINQADVIIGAARAYPYALPVDNIMPPYPLNDLSFDTWLGRYYESHDAFDTDNWRIAALVGKYWTRYLRNVIDHTSKVITGEFLMSVNDINTLDFQNEFVCEDFVLRLNKIIDWDLNGTGICKCEFLLRVY